MKVAVIGGGIAGLSAAYHLQGRAEVTVFEKNGRIGGHTDTHAILVDGQTYSVDSGFIVFNRPNYPAFSRWLDDLGVESQPSEMSFGVCNEITGLEYGTSHLGALLCQRRNLGSWRFWQMLRDLRRFYSDAKFVSENDTRSLGEFVASQRYSRSFVDNHLAPMCGALWSVPFDHALDIPVYHVVAFMAQHRMLQIDGRPEWRVVRGGSSKYLEAFHQRFRGSILTHSRIRGVCRAPGRVTVELVSDSASFDAVVLACHSDQALSLLQDATAPEQEILGAIPYRKNRVVVHSDPSVMPSRRSAWSSWNARVNGERGDACQVSYWMNRLQSLPAEQDFFVTLNPTCELDDVWSVREYAHPEFTAAARAAQSRSGEINGRHATYYCGAYWGWGFHEDAYTSGMRVAAQMCEELARVA